MENPVLDQICSQIYSDISSILLENKINDLENVNLSLIEGAVSSYLIKELEQNRISVMPIVKAEIVNNNVMLRFYDNEGNKIGSIDEIVKLSANWNVGS